jgi:hypothetical protein
VTTAALAVEGEPIPGDPDGIEQLARDLLAMAVALEDQTTALRGLADEEWVGSAADVFREKRKKIPDVFAKLEGRYQATAAALVAYAPALRSARDMALAAVR